MHFRFVVLICTWNLGKRNLSKLKTELYYLQHRQTYFQRSLIHSEVYVSLFYHFFLCPSTFSRPWIRPFNSTTWFSWITNSISYLEGNRYICLFCVCLYPVTMHLGCHCGPSEYFQNDEHAWDARSKSAVCFHKNGEMFYQHRPRLSLTVMTTLLITYQRVPPINAYGDLLICLSSSFLGPDTRYYKF